jgi:hypothetical protein
MGERVTANFKIKVRVKSWLTACPNIPDVQVLVCADVLNITEFRYREEKTHNELCAKRPEMKSTRQGVDGELIINPIRYEWTQLKKKIHAQAN